MAGPASYRVLWSSTALAALRGLRTRAQTLAQRQELARIVRSLDTRLRQDPLEVGEVYRSRGVIAEHIAIRQFLAIDFAVDQNHRLVLVRACRSLLDRERDDE